MYPCYVGVSRQGWNYTKTATGDVGRHREESKEVLGGNKLPTSSFPSEKSRFRSCREIEEGGTQPVPRKEDSEISHLHRKKGDHLPDSLSEGKKINLNLVRKEKSNQPPIKSSFPREPRGLKRSREFWGVCGSTKPHLRICVIPWMSAPSGKAGGYSWSGRLDRKSLPSVPIAGLRSTEDGW